MTKGYVHTTSGIKWLEKPTLHGIPICFGNQYSFTENATRIASEFSQNVCGIRKLLEDFKLETKDD